MAIDKMETLEQQQEDTERGRFLTFSLGEEAFGVEVRYVLDIVNIEPITPLCDVPPYIKGIFNQRSKVLTAIDMRLKFGMEPIAYNERTCVIVIEMDDLTAGFIVDAVTEVITIEEEHIVAAPEDEGKILNTYLYGVGMVGDDLKLLLDCPKLLQE